MVQVGDVLKLVERPYPTFTLQLINEQTHRQIDETIARQLLDIPELAGGWKKIIQWKLEKGS
jgi:MOSC domain-containing protein YiiM